MRFRERFFSLISVPRLPEDEESGRQRRSVQSAIAQFKSTFTLYNFINNLSYVLFLFLYGLIMLVLVLVRGSKYKEKGKDQF